MKTATIKCVPCNGTGRVPDMKSIGKQVKLARINAGMTLKEMAATVGISISYLSDIEQGRKRSKRAIALAKMLTTKGKDNGRT